MDSKLLDYSKILKRFKFLGFILLVNRAVFLFKPLPECYYDRDINGNIFKRKPTFFKEFISFGGLFLYLFFILLYFCYCLFNVLGFGGLKVKVAKVLKFGF